MHKRECDAPTPKKKNNTEVLIESVQLLEDLYPGSGDGSSCGWVALIKLTNRLYELCLQNDRIKAIHKIVQGNTRAAVTSLLCRATISLTSESDFNEYAKRCSMLKST